MDLHHSVRTLYLTNNTGFLSKNDLLTDLLKKSTGGEVGGGGGFEKGLNAKVLGFLDLQ